MKIKVEYYLPRISVSEEIEIGKITNNHLNKRQSAQVDKLVKEILAVKLQSEFKDKLKPKVIIKGI